MKLYKVKLTTANKTDEQIKARYDDEVSKEEIEQFKKALSIVNELEINVMKRSYNGVPSYVLIGWEEKDDHIMRDFVYEMEQDPMFGSYVDDRESFLQDWENEEYEPTGSLSFESEDLEIVEELKKAEQ